MNSSVPPKTRWQILIGLWQGQSLANGQSGGVDISEVSTQWGVANEANETFMDSTKKTFTWLNLTHILCLLMPKKNVA